jgi:hypothetical protein
MKFKFYQNDIVEKARKLRESKESIGQIAKRLSIGKTTISRWCEDIVLDDNQYQLRARKEHENAKTKGASVARNIKINSRTARLFASILYWCEGSKYPSSNFIAFANSDVGLVVTFLELFRIGYNPKEDKIRVSLQLHTTHNETEMTAFWSNKLKISKNQFYKTTFTNPTKNMKRKNYKGTCTIRYYDVSLLLEITGAFEAFSRKNYQ